MLTIVIEVDAPAGQAIGVKEHLKEKLVELLLRSRKLVTAPRGLSFDEMARCVYEHTADHLIANGVTIQEWISVEERLPEYGEKVIACDTREDYVGIAVLQKGKHLWWPNPESYWSWGEMELALDEFTHWMPLPEPPKGE